MFKERKEKLRKYIHEKDIKAVFITNNINIYYLTGFYSNPRERLTMYILGKDNVDYLLVPALDKPKVSDDSASFIITYKDHEDPIKKMDKLLPNNKDGKIGIEYSDLNLKWYSELLSLISEDYFVNIDSLITNLRKVKSTEEINSIERAIEITEQGIQHGIDLLNKSMTEKDIAKEIENKLYMLGASDIAFTVKVLSAESSALPHGKPQHKKIKNDSFVLFDVGAEYKGYKADISRTVVLGDCSEDMLKIYTVVETAINKVINAIKPGVSFSDLDKLARNYISQKGYGEFFLHRLGHGLGLELHEYPSIHENNNDIIEEGMIITIEPGIYIPDLGGV